MQHTVRSGIMAHDGR